MAPYSGPVRIIGRDEEENALELCRRLWSENGTFSLSEKKVREALSRAFDKQGGILAGVGPRGDLHGLLYLWLDTYWYSDDPHWTELFLYVTPEHRKSKNAVELLQFAKWCVDESNIPLVIGIFSSESTARKELLYERQLNLEGKGKFFLYKKKQPSE